MGNWTGRIVSVLAVLFLLIYAGYQAYRYTYTPYRTETAYEYTVSETFQAKGIIIRDEVLVEEKFLEKQKLKIGDIIKLSSNDVIGNTEFKIAGTVKSPLYINNSDFYSNWCGND